MPTKYYLSIHPACHHSPSFSTDLHLPLTAVQALSIKAAVEEPQTDSKRAVLLIERARDSKGPASRAGHLSQALQRLAALPAIQPPKPTGICHSLEGVVPSAYEESNAVLYPCSRKRYCVLPVQLEALLCL